MKLEEARALLQGYTKGTPLLSHAESVSIVMGAYARKYGEDEEKWRIAGLLHDADYEAHPKEHPHIIVNRLKELGEDEIAYAISAHYSHWGNSCKSLMDKALLASDELTGFVVACARLRPEHFDGLKVSSVIKKLKQNTFAAGVDRGEVHLGAELLEITLEEHIHFIIEALKEANYQIPQK